MTQEKREPFAAIPHRFNGWITVGPCSFLTMMSGDDLRGAVDSINAAFNARVDEEVKEAVEESEKWRRAAILLGERIGTVGPNGYYSFTADQFFEWVKGLPTEPKP